MIATAMARPTLDSLVKQVGIPLASLDQRCSDEHIRDISLFVDWRNVAPHLGLSEADIEDIDYEKKTPSEKRLKTLQKWKSKYGYMATFKGLVSALLKIEKADQAERVCRLLQPQDSQGSGAATAFVTASDQPLVPQQQQGTTNWEYQTLSRNSTAIVRAITDNRLTNNLANELRAREMIGRAVHAQATNYAPNITDDMRARYLIDAMLSKVGHNPQRYYDFIEVLKVDSMRADAEVALALLPTGPPQGSGGKVAAQNTVHPSLPPSSRAGATEDTLGEDDLTDIKCYLINLEKKHIYELGIVLGLKQPKVKKMKDSDTFTDDVVSAWLRREDAVEKKGLPSWRTLVKALRHQLVGQNGVANDICKAKGIRE